jgi:PTS system nitrogen regulatory IIA component
LSARLPDSTLSKWLPSELVLPALVATSASGVLEEIAEGVSRAVTETSAAAIRLGFLEREELGTTAVGNGFAIPHCRVEGASRVHMAVAMHPVGVDFGAPDGTPVRLFFAIVAPLSRATGHLEALAAVARLLREPDRRELLLRARGERELMTALRADALCLASAGEPSHV